MAFRRPTNHRRSQENEELLDVSLPAEVEAGERSRRAAKGLVWTMIAAAVLLTFWKGGGMALDRIIYNNPSFAIRRIEVYTDGVISPEAIRSWAGARLGENLPALDLMRIKQNLAAQPFIQSVAIERALPHTLRLRVSEREPVAQTMVMQPKPDGSFDQVVYLFDEEGHVMRPLEARLLSQPQAAATDNLPMLLGARVSDLQPGARVDSPQIRASLSLLLDFERSPMFGLVELRRVNVSSPEILQATTSQGSEITFSLSNFDQQFRRWRAIYDMYEKTGRAVASLDLSIANNLPVRWVEAGALQPAAPKAVRPRRTRR
jgi:cell division septal protein FtsQ